MKQEVHVLLVDDEVELVETLAERLSFRGIDADWATSCDEALDRAKSTKYDVAVLDVKLPNTSGLDLKMQLKAIQPELGVIFLTGHGSEEDSRRGRALAGESFYLVKPVSIDVLISKIKEVFQEQR